MDWAEVEMKWAQVGGQFREKYGQLTRQDIESLSGDKVGLVGILRESYGYSQEVAERHAEEWRESLSNYYSEIPTSTSGASTY